MRGYGGCYCVPGLMGAEGRHKACPYRGVRGEYCWLEALLGKNEHGA